MGARSRRPPPPVQGRFAFIRRAERREILFKRLILLTTALVVAGLLARNPGAADRIRLLLSRGRGLVAARLGLASRETLIAEYRAAQRRVDAASARRTLAATIEPNTPIAELLRAARMDAETGLIRWGNFNYSLLLSSAVLEADDNGRSYRFRPCTRSVWVIGLSLRDVAGLFLIPDTKEARDAAQRAGGRVVEASLQTTNSWGCRGPEPDPSAPLRVLVLGDSVMQGALIGDAQTPPARLGRHLAAALGQPVDVLNTGHLGYSLEQYYHTLRAFAERYRPHVVVISVTGNDFGDLQNPANWEESRPWIQDLSLLCQRMEIPFLLVPVPVDQDVMGARDLSLFPGKLTHLYRRGGDRYFDPLEGFVDRHLEIQIELMRAGSFDVAPLYNLHLMGDRHLSPRGADLWGGLVARRLLLAWEYRALQGMNVPAPVLEYARRRAGFPPGQAPAFLGKAVP